jgi:hypothetical protein
MKEWPERKSWACRDDLNRCDHPRLVLQTCQQPFEEARRRLGIAPGLDEDVEHDAVLITARQR